MPVVAIKSARVSEFQGGKTLNIGNSTVMQTNPDIPKAHQLRGWYDQLNDTSQFTSISNRVGGDGGEIDSNGRFSCTLLHS